MARNFRRAGFGLAIWILVLVALFSKELWSLFGVGVVAVVVAIIFFIATMLLSAKPGPPDIAKETSHTHEPTCAGAPQQTHHDALGNSDVPTLHPAGPSEPAALSKASSQHRLNESSQGLPSLGPVQPPAIPQDRLMEVQGQSIQMVRKSDARLDVPGAGWNRDRDAGIEEARRRAEHLRKKLEALTEVPASSATVPALSVTPTEPPSPTTTFLPPSSSTDALAPEPECDPESFVHKLQDSPQPECLYSVSGAANPAADHVLPAAPSDVGVGRWVPPGESIEVAGVNLPGGMLYVGGKLKALNGGAEPCLVSDQYTVARAGDYHSSQMGYWPSYAEASAEERRAYLNWLSEGRSNPDCDIGYVLLFFYGLERRVIVDSRDNPAARGDWPAITAELRRLLAIYGEKSGSFNRYAGELLSWIELDGKSSQLYKQPVPDFPRGYGWPPYLRLALGQAAVDRAPLPEQLALAWLRSSPECRLRTAATRCPGLFERLFAQRYHEILGAGLLLPKNCTKLKFTYQAASAGLRGADITMTFGDIPDVVALIEPVKKLMEIASLCTDELDSYSRLVGRNPAAAEALEGLLLLPASLWPDAMQVKLRALTVQMGEGRLSLSLKELLDALGGTNQVLDRDRVQSLARVLEGAEIGLEPHVLGGAKAPGERDTVVLFAQPVIDSDVGSRAEYKMAALTLQLASTVALADGKFDELEVVHLRAEIEGWSYLTLAERRRLHAHLQWLTTSPVNLSALKRKLEPLPTMAREALAGFMAALVQADGIVLPDEVNFLGKVYKVLGVEPKRVFSDIHAAGSGGAPSLIVQPDKKAFRLDTARIAVLQEDTARVSALLSKIFAEEDGATPATPASTPEIEDKANSPLGLDEGHSTLLHLLLTRPEWGRAELGDAAANLNLMLDGALELLNEAAFDTFDEPLFEGEDPISVNTNLREKIKA